MSTHPVRCLVGMLVVASCCTSTHGDARLELVLTSDPYIPTGLPVTCQLWMHVPCDAAQPPSAGFQAFLAFPTDQLAFVSGTYTTTPFGLRLLPIINQGGTLSLASGIAPAQGQLPVCGDHLLATLTFVALTPGPGCTLVRFIPHAPASCLAGAAGAPILPLLLTATPPAVAAVDFDNDCDVDGVDFATFASCLAGPGVHTPPAGCDPADFARADNEPDVDVDLADFARFQQLYTGGL